MYEDHPGLWLNLIILFQNHTNLLTIGIPIRMKHPHNDCVTITFIQTKLQKRSLIIYGKRA